MWENGTALAQQMWLITNILFCRYLVILFRLSQYQRGVYSVIKQNNFQGQVSCIYYHCANILGID